MQLRARHYGIPVDGGHMLAVHESLAAEAAEGAKRSGAHSQCDELFLVHSIMLY